MTEERLNFALITSSDGMWDWDLISNEVYFSPRWKEMLGYQDDELDNTFMAWESRLHPEDKAEVMQTIKENLNGKQEHFNITFRLKHKDGHWVWINSRAKTFFDDNQLPVHLSGLHTDITKERELLEENIRQSAALDTSQNLLRTIINTVPVRIFWKDINSVYIGCNDIFAHDAALNHNSEIIGMTDDDLIWKNQAALYRKDDREVIQSGRGKYEYEEPQTRSDTETVWLKTSKVPLRDEHGNVSGVLGVYTDISKEREQNLDLKRHKKLLEDAERIAHLGSWYWDIPNNTIEWSDETFRIFGLEPQSITPDYETFLSFIPEDMRSLVTNAVTKSIDDHSIYEVEHPIILQDGTLRYVKEHGTAHYDKSNEPVAMVGTVMDITKLKLHELEDEKRQQQNTAFQEALLTWAKVDYTHFEEALHTATEISAQALDESSVSLWLIDDENSNLECVDLFDQGAQTHISGMYIDREEYPDYFQTVLKGQILIAEDAKSHPMTEKLLTHRALAFDVISMMEVPVLSEGKIAGVLSFKQTDKKRRYTLEEQEFALAIANNISLALEIKKRRIAEDLLAHKAHHDELTGLPNRSLFLDRLEMAIKKAERYSKGVAVLFVDLDNFKQINDSMGHQAGDIILKKIAALLSEHIREADTFARLGGDEFTLIIDMLDDVQRAAEIAEKLLELLKVPFTVQGQEIFVTTSIGISTYPNDGHSADTLLRNADSAMYKAKNEGKNAYQFYTSDMTELAFERILMETSLRQAIANEEFTIHYQPQYDTKLERIIGMEALVRWEHPSQGMIPPGRFIPLAEDTGLIIPLDFWVMRTAMKQLKSWYVQGYNPGKLSLNLSIKQLQKEDFIDNLKALIDEIRIDPRYLSMEITESQVMKDPEHAIKMLKELTQLGIHLAVDDFGTGYSSLSYLKRLPIHKLKIDQTFVRGTPDDKEDVAIVQAVIALAKSLNLELIAEGVETQEQSDFLKAHACCEIQGYLFSRPLPKEAMETLLKTYNHHADH